MSLIKKGSRFYLVFHPWHNADHSKYFMNVFWNLSWMENYLLCLPFYPNPRCLHQIIQFHLWSCSLFLVPGFYDVAASPWLVSWPSSVRPAPARLGRVNFSYLLYTLLLWHLGAYYNHFCLFTGFSSTLNLRWNDILVVRALLHGQTWIHFSHNVLDTWTWEGRTLNFFKLLFLPL